MWDAHHPKTDIVVAVVGVVPVAEGGTQIVRIVVPRTAALPGHPADPKTGPLSIACPYAKKSGPPAAAQ